MPLINQQQWQPPNATQDNEKLGFVCVKRNPIHLQRAGVCIYIHQHIYINHNILTFDCMYCGGSNMRRQMDS